MHSITMLDARVPSYISRCQLYSGHAPYYISQQPGCFAWPTSGRYSLYHTLVLDIVSNFSIYRNMKYRSFGILYRIERVLSSIDFVIPVIFAQILNESLNVPVSYFELVSDSFLFIDMVSNSIIIRYRYPTLLYMHTYHTLENSLLNMPLSFTKRFRDMQ